MSIFTKLGVSVAAPFDASGNPRQISPQDFQIWMTEVERLIKGLLAGVGGVELPELIYKYVIIGGDQNAIIAQPNAEVTAGVGEALFTIDITRANTGDVTINGKPLLTSSGNQIVAGGLVPGIWIFLDEGANFRLVSDQASQAIMTAVENALFASQAAQQAAEDARDIAAGYASDVVSQGNVPIYSTLAGITSLEIPAGVNAIRVNGRLLVGDGLGGLYIDTDNGSADTFVSGDGRTWYRVELNNVILTVGVGGDFSTLNEAIFAASKMKDFLFKNNDNFLEIRLLEGFILHEQIFVKNIDLGYITITSDAPTVWVKRSALNTVYKLATPFIDSTLQYQDRYPAFAAFNATLPTIGCKFTMDTSSPHTGYNDGILLDGGSAGNALDGCGFTDANGRALFVGKGSCFNAVNFCVDRSHTGVMATEGGRASLPFLKARLSGTGGAIVAIFSGYVAAFGADATDATRIAIECRDNSHVDVRNGDISRATLYGIHCQHGSLVNARSIAGRNCLGIALYSRWASVIEAMDAILPGCLGDYTARAQEASVINLASTNIGGSDLTNSLGIALYAEGVSTINAPSVKMSGCKTRTVLSTRGSTVNIYNAVLDDCSSGIFASQAGMINANDASIKNCGARAVEAITGAKVNVEGAMLTGALGEGIYASGGATVNGARADCSGYRGSNGITAYQGSNINFTGGKARKASTDGSSDIRIVEGSTINAVGAQGGTNNTPNIITSNGVVYK